MENIIEQAISKANKIKDETKQLKAIKPPDQIAEEKAENGDEKKLSPKHKLSRGVDPSLKTTWVPFDAEPDLNEKLRKAAAQSDKKIGDMLAEWLREIVKSKDEEITSLATEYDSTRKTSSLEGKSADDLQKLLAKEQAKLEQLQKLVAEVKAKKLAEATTTTDA